MFRVARCIAQLAPVFMVLVSESGDRVFAQVRVGAERVRGGDLNLTDIQGRVPHGRIVVVEPPLRAEDVNDPAGPRRGPGELAPMPSGVPIVVIELDDDATMTRNSAGGVAAASFPPVEATVFLQDADSGFVLTNKGDAGNFMANQLVLAGGWTPGGNLSGYDLTVYNADTGGPGTVVVSLWNGDPLGTDTDCMMMAGAVPIPGTTARFSNIPVGTAACPAGSGQSCVGLYKLKATFPSPIRVNCADVWMVVEIARGCRLGWRVSGTPGFVHFSPPQIGTSDNFEIHRDCGQSGECPTVSGYNAGVCCDNCGPMRGQACDHSDGSYECGHEAYCSDGTAELVDAYSLGGGYYAGYASYVASVFTPAKRIISIIPVGNRPNGGLDSGVVIRDGTEIILPSGGRNVFLEARFGDWDPDDLGARLRAYVVAVDRGSFSSGLNGTLTLPSVPCAGTEAQAQCTQALGRGSLCDVPTGCEFDGVPCRCEAAYLDVERGGTNSFVFAGVPALICASSEAGNDFRILCFNSGLQSHSPLPPNPFPLGGLYAGTFVLYVPPEALGTFTISPLPSPETQLADQAYELMPLVGLKPAKVTVLGTQAEQALMPLHQTTPQPEGTVAVDECACPILSPPIRDGVGSKNRYVSFRVQAFGGMQAVRVRLQNLPAPFAYANGRTLWVGPPAQVSEVSGKRSPQAFPSFPVFWTARLQCTPFYTDWTQYEMVHVYDANIVPGATYRLQVIDGACPTNDETAYSSPLDVSTARHGDVAGTCSARGCNPPDGQVDITTDALAMVWKYTNRQGAPLKVQTDLATGLPDQVIDNSDIIQVIDAFRSLPYNYAGPPILNPCGAD